jgi:hypothetical protein
VARRGSVNLSRTSGFLASRFRPRRRQGSVTSISNSNSGPSDAPPDPLTGHPTPLPAPSGPAYAYAAPLLGRLLVRSRLIGATT